MLHFVLKTHLEKYEAGELRVIFAACGEKLKPQKGFGTQTFIDPHDPKCSDCFPFTAQQLLAVNG